MPDVPQAQTPPVRMDRDDERSAPSPFAPNTPASVYADRNYTLRVPPSIHLSWRNAPADDVLQSALQTIRGGCNVVANKSVKNSMARPFANYDWSHYSDEIGSLFVYFWIMLFSVQYGAVRGTDNASADEIRKAWRFFRTQTKLWFERAGFFAIEWMDGAVRQLDSPLAADRFDTQIRALQSIYLSGAGLRASLAREMEIAKGYQLSVQTYDAVIASLANLSGVGMEEGQPKLAVLQQIVNMQKTTDERQRQFMLKVAPLPESLLASLRRTVAPSAAPTAVKKYLDEIGELNAKVTVLRSTVKTLEKRIDKSKLTSERDNLKREVADLRQQLANSASAEQLAKSASETLAKSVAVATVSPSVLDALRKAVPAPGIVADKGIQNLLDNFSKMKIDLAVERNNNAELQRRVASKPPEDALDRQIEALTKQLAACKADQEADRFRVQAASETFAKGVSVGTVPPAVLEALRKSVPSAGTLNDKSVKKLLADYNEMRFKLASEVTKNNELQKRVASKPSEDALNRQIEALTKQLDDCKAAREADRIRVDTTSAVFDRAVSIATVPPELLATLRDAVPRQLSAASESIIKNMRIERGRLEAELIVKDSTIKELRNQLAQHVAAAEASLLRASFAPPRPSFTTVAPTTSTSPYPPAPAPAPATAKQRTSP